MPNPFQTPTSEKSFSGLIDAVILATGKPQSLVSITQYAQAVIRECQSLGLFAQDMVEDSIDVPAGSTAPITWTRPAFFRSLRTVKYLNCSIYPELALPGRKQKDLCNYFYAADDYFVFKGEFSQQVADTIAIATYYWSTPLAYFNRLGVNSSIFPGGPYDIRPAFYSVDDMKWQYLNATSDGYIDTTGDAAVDTFRRKQAMNWMVDQWYDLILAGTKSKTFSAAGDPRATTEYSIYKQQQKILQNTASYEGEGF